jgi:alpha-beta hydrolase superfamily lysophospholipase
VYGVYLPQEPPKATVLLSHGYGEHMGRYAHVIASLVARGYAVYAIDHRGHGASQGRRALVERFEYFVDDLRLLADKARAAYPDLPRFVVGHSLGGLIAFHYAARYQAELSGLVLSGPALKSDVAPNLRRVARLLGTTLPWLQVTPLATGPESALSRDPEIQRLFDADPLTYTKKMKAGMGYQMLRGIALAEPLMAQLTLPLLIVQGEADLIVNPEGAKQLYAAARSADKTLKLYPECRHEIFNELIKDEALALVGEWLDAHVAQRAGQPAQLQAV